MRVREGSGEPETVQSGVVGGAREAGRDLPGRMQDMEGWDHLNSSLCDLEQAACPL